MTIESLQLIKENLPDINAQSIEKIKTENKRWEVLKELHEILFYNRELITHSDIDPIESKHLFKKLSDSFWELAYIVNPNYWSDMSKQKIKREWKNKLKTNLSKKEQNILEL